LRATPPNLADISVPVLLLHGKQDMFVPFGHGAWLAGACLVVRSPVTEGTDYSIG
jgi:pimeloyl-ACP methyl ester carboxylesterase